MGFVQFFETVLIDETSDSGARLISVPAAALPQEQQARLSTPVGAIGETPEPTPLSALAAEFAQSFDDGRVLGFFPPENLQRLLTTVLAADSNEGRIPEEGPAEFGLLVAPRFDRAAAYIAREPVIPMTMSGLDLHSFGDVAASASGAGVGAYVGLLLIGPSPLLLLTVPAGIVLVMASRGAGRAVAAAAEYHLRKLLRVPEDWRREQP